MAKKVEVARVTITAPDIGIAEFHIIGTSPFVQLRFTEKAKNQIMQKQIKGSRAKKDTAREPRDFDAEYQQAMHVSADGWRGIPASAFRNALISACRLTGFKMTQAKLAVFIDADGFDALDAIPLVRINGEPCPDIRHVRNASGVVDLRMRAMWKQWDAMVRIRYDCGLFSLEDVTNLLMRVGMQVGIGEGRPDGKQSAGMGWGTFRLDNGKDRQP